MPASQKFSSGIPRAAESNAQNSIIPFRHSSRHRIQCPKLNYLPQAFLAPQNPMPKTQLSLSGIPRATKSNAQNSIIPSRHSSRHRIQCPKLNYLPQAFLAPQNPMPKTQLSLSGIPRAAESNVQNSIIPFRHSSHRRIQCLKLNYPFQAFLAPQNPMPKTQLSLSGIPRAAESDATKYFFKTPPQPPLISSLPPFLTSPFHFPLFQLSTTESYRPEIVPLSREFSLPDESAIQVPPASLPETERSKYSHLPECS